MPFNADTALSLSQVSKRYVLTRKRPWRAAEVFFHPLSFARELWFGEPFWALRDVSIAIRRGEFVGIIGSNGSGKSTLLRIMAGLSPPTAGTVTTRGHLASLLELGSGFHFLATGRENAYINGLLMGLSKRAIRELMPDIIRFAELEEFADQPMRTYSQGMSLRLSFSVAVHVQPEILLVDEVLAVGDADFQEKCYDHFEMLKREGVTIVLVSHDLDSIERFADRVLVLEQGRVAAEGEPAEMVGRYLTRLAEKSPAVRRSLERALKERMRGTAANVPASAATDALRHQSLRKERG